MNRAIKNTQVILIGGSSHVGKSTLGKYLARKLNGDYLATDSLAKHPGRPWTENGRAVREHVAEHYRTLSTKALLEDVLFHYQQNVLPQIATMIHDYRLASSNNCLVIEGSALYPALVKNIVSQSGVKAVWLVANEQLLKNRIYNQSNFVNLDRGSQQLVQKFLNRTLLYQEYMRDELERLQFCHINLESDITLEELSQKLLKLLRFLVD